MYCSHCGGTVKEGDRFCNQCGNSIVPNKQTDQSSSRYANSGYKNRASSTYQNDYGYNASNYGARYYGNRSATPTRYNGTSIAALIVGIVSLPFFVFVLPSIVAIILAVIGMRQSDLRQEQGKPLAIAALIAGIVSLLIGLFVWIMLFFPMVILGGSL